MQSLHAGPLKGGDLHLEPLVNEFLTCNVMQSLHTCLTTKRGGFAHGDLEHLVNEFLTSHVMPCNHYMLDLERGRICTR